MSLFSKKINEITFDDVVSFCKLGISESINLDYKENFTEKLEKTISSFANSNGGLIIIGIKDENSKPKEPFTGLDFVRGMEERIWSIILDNIYPPLFPEVFICPPVNNKTFAIIRVQESESTPYAIFNNTKVYIRTGNITKLEDLATINQIGWLLDKRKKSVEFKESIEKRAELRCENLTGGLSSYESLETIISFCPVFPSKTLIDFDKIENLIQTIRDTQLSNMYYFPQSFYDPYPNQDGIYFFLKNIDLKKYEYSEINQFGLYFNKKNANGNSAKEINIFEILRLLRNSLINVYYFYNNIGFRGLFELFFKLNNINNCVILKSKTNLSEPNKFIIQNELSWKRTICMGKINNEEYFVELIKDLFKEILWSLGLKIETVDLDNIIDKNIKFKDLFKT